MNWLPKPRDVIVAVLASVLAPIVIGFIIKIGDRYLGGNR